MRGIPKYLNTKNDYLNIKRDFPSQWHDRFQALLDAKDNWINMGVISEGSGTTDSTHKVVEIPKPDGTTEEYQFEYKEDPGARLFLLGFTISELQAHLA